MFQITPAVKNMLIITIAVHLLVSMVFPEIKNMLAMHYYASSQFQPFQIVTSMFTHYNANHIFGNMLGLFFFGPLVERATGSQKFLIFYLTCGIGSTLIYAGVQAWEFSQLDMANEVNRYIMEESSLMGASGAVFGIFMAGFLLFPNLEVQLIIPPIPVKMKYLIGFYGAYEFFRLLKHAQGDNVAHLAHLAGMLIAFIMIRYWKIPKIY